MVRISILTFSMIGGLSFLLSCGKGKGDQPTDPIKKDSVEQTTNIPKVVILTCTDRSADEFDVPINEVGLSIDGKAQILDTIRTACNPISPTEYKSFQIPTDATSACGGWWAGGGDYFYTVIRDGKVKVFQGWQDEGQDDEGYHWKEIPVNY